MDNTNKNQAIVIGCSISGIMAAKVLSNYFNKVTVLEQDSFSNRYHRRGTPQATHTHILLVKGVENMFSLFPLLEEDLLSQGAQKFDFLKNGRFLVPTGWAKVIDSNLITVSCTRNLLESSMRRQLLECDNVEISENTSVNGLIYDHDKNIVTGVKTSPSYNKSTTDQDNTFGSFVVDTSGRNSKTSQWIQNLGIGHAPETHVESNVAYSTRYYQAPKDIEYDWNIIAILNRPPNEPNMGGIMRIEDNKWIVTMYSIGRDFPPTDQEGFETFAYNLPSKDIYNLIAQAKPISPIYGYRFKGSTFRHYEKVSKWPENFISFGDAACTFNPFYGQGITTASIGAKTLDKILKKHINNKKDSTTNHQNTPANLVGISKKFQNKIAKENSYPWLLATGEDFRWPTTKGKKPSLITRKIQEYADKIILLTPESKRSTLYFQQMMQMVKSPIILFHPELILRAAYRTLKPRPFFESDNDKIALKN